ncbi:PucR family transcriptional regulator [Pseudobutyrivibrio sp.]|uniref:PucR family transcriptional regulator n=1 Tax=Pseudobutyrivibrio sp. TaxID=2014367 RepID=UPI00386F861F
MNFEEKKDKLLDQLNRATGINFEISDTGLSDEETLNKLKEMIIHFNAVDSKSGLYRLYLRGELAYSDAVSSLHRFHIEENGIRQVFYLESQADYTKEAVSLLKSLIPDSKDVVLEVDNKHIVIIINYEAVPSKEEIVQIANSYLDMLEAEAFTSFKLSYSKSVNTFKELPASYKDSILAMNIGNTFNSNGRIYCYDDLGLGRLLYNIPGEEVEAYLNKHINIDLLSQIDEETLNLLDSFFANDLSLAETSRKMFIHRNTLIYRLDKFADLTGYDVRKFSDAITVKISLMLYNYINSQK